MANLQNKKLPIVFDKKFQTYDTLHTHFTRSPKWKTFVQPQHVCSRTSKSIAISGVKNWNSLPPDVRNCSGKYIFKKKLKDYLLNSQLT